MRWRIRVGDSTRVTNLRIIRPLGGGLFTGAGTSPSVLPPINATTSYNVQLPIRIGDYIGIDCCARFFEPGAEFFVTGRRRPQRVAAKPRRRWARAAAVQHEPLRGRAQRRDQPPRPSPSTRSRATRRTGTATLTVTVAHAGELTGAGKGVKVANAATSSETVTAPGSVQLLIKAKGKKKKKLKSTGKVKVKPKITYTPTGGETDHQIGEGEADKALGALVLPVVVDQAESRRRGGRRGTLTPRRFRRKVPRLSHSAAR